MLVLLKRTMHYYFPGMIVGFILLQTAIIAPTLSKKLENKDFSVVIRALWPKFFLCLSVLGISTIITLYFHTNPSTFHYTIAVVTAILASIYYAIIPATKRASDEGNQKVFKILHKMSIYLTVSILILNVGFLLG